MVAVVSWLPLVVGVIQATRKQLVRQAYPEAPLSIWEVLTKDHFVNAIADTDICWKVLQTRPGTVQVALTTATEVEAFQISEHQRLRSTDCEYRGHTGFRQTP